MAKIMTPDEFTCEGWKRLLGDREERKIGHNTWLVGMHNGGVAIVYHNTPIVEYAPDGGIYINFGGWGTVTTRQRMNACLPQRYTVYQLNYVQRAVTDMGDIEVDTHGVHCVQHPKHVEVEG